MLPSSFWATAFSSDAVAEQGRVIHCTALDHDALRSTTVAVLKALTSTEEGTTHLFSFSLVLPAVSARQLTRDDGQPLKQLTSEHKIDIRLREPHRLAPSERLLAIMGHIAVLPAVISSLLTMFPHPFQYQDMVQWDSGSGVTGEEHQQSARDLPLNVAAQRYKRKSAQERAATRAAKCLKTTAWHATKR